MFTTKLKFLASPIPKIRIKIYKWVTLPWPRPLLDVCYS